MNATTTFTTERLTLRPYRRRDVPVLTEALQDPAIASMLPALPFPYTRRDAEDFVTNVAPYEQTSFVLEHHGVLIGSVSAHNQLGYWLHPVVWGHGFATEAAHAVLALRFAEDQSPVPSGHRVGNERSRRVLLRLGFRDTARRNMHSNRDDESVTMQDMTLQHADWEALV